MSERKKVILPAAVAGTIMVGGVAIALLSDRDSGVSGLGPGSTDPSSTTSSTNPQLNASAAEVVDGLKQAYAACAPGPDMDAYQVISPAEPDSVITFPVTVERNPAVVQRPELGIVYKGLVATNPMIGPPQTRGQLDLEGVGTDSPATFTFPAIDVYGPNSVSYNLYGVAEATDPTTGRLITSYTPCGAIAISGHTNAPEEMSAMPAEFGLPTGDPAIVLHHAG